MMVGRVMGSGRREPGFCQVPSKTREASSGAKSSDGDHGLKQHEIERSTSRVNSMILSPAETLPPPIVTRQFRVRLPVGDVTTSE
jgi:hypothetical protein